MRIQRIPASEPAFESSEQVDLSLLHPIIEKYKNKQGNLIPILQKTQDLYGYIPKVAFLELSDKTGLELSDMYGVATFYSQFRLKPAGKYIVKICHGTACHVQNANEVTESISEALNVNDGGTTPDNLFTLESVACLGCCSLAPVMMIGDETYGKLSGKNAVKIIKEIRLNQTSK